MAEQDKGNGKQNGEDSDGGSSEFNNFQQLLKQVLSVPKEKIDESKAEHQREKERKRAG